MTESQLQVAVADYLRLQHSSALFHSDYGSGVKLTARQAAVQKRQNGGRRGFPDLFIYEARCGYYGLAIELKKDGVRLEKKNGEWASEHIAEQATMIERLRERGYAAGFAVGFEAAKKLIDAYLGGVYTADAYAD